LSSPPPEPELVPLEQAASSAVAASAATMALRDFMISPTLEGDQAEAVKV
jgi:hypothetical protein